MTSTITRDKLHQLYTENLAITNEKNIQLYVINIHNKILEMNNKGDKSYCHIFHKTTGNGEEPAVIREIARRLQEIFADSDVIFHEKNGYTESQIIINWRI